MRRALPATHSGEGLDGGRGTSGDLGGLQLLGLDEGLGEQVCVDVDEFRARYFTVRGARPVLIEHIEENEVLDAANGGTSGHGQSPGMLVDVPQASTNRRRRGETAPGTPDRRPTIRSARPAAPY